LKFEGAYKSFRGYIAKKLHPGLIFVSLHFDRYIEKSRQVMTILKEYDPTMAKGGLDEAYLE
jgi:DNA polymerase kappa